MAEKDGEFLNKEYPLFTRDGIVEDCGATGSRLPIVVREAVPGGLGPAGRLLLGKAADEEAQHWLEDGLKGA